MEALILSYALDTNGQNARYVRASEKFGADDGVLSALAVGRVDPGGVVGRFQLAAEKLGTLRIRSVHRSAQYFEFPADIVWTRHTAAEIKQLAERADVIHLNNSSRAATTLGVQRKPTLLHHHGSLFRNNTAQMLADAKARRWTQAVSTMDLREPAPEILHWLPTAYDIDWLVAFGQENRVQLDPDRILVVSCPTNRDLKATAELIAAVEHLQADGLPIDLDLVEGLTWTECLQRKAQADILFDQVAFGYGCNAVEAWGMGIPVIAGGEPWTMGRMELEWGGLPFYRATVETIVDSIRTLATSADQRLEWAERGMAHVRKYHDERPALERLAELYHMALATHGAAFARTAVEAVTFRNNLNRAVYDPVSGERITFNNREYRTDDAYVIDHLRKFAKLRPRYGIEEVVA